MLNKPNHPVKVLWLQGEDTLRKVSYFNSEAEAEKAIVNSRDREWGKAIVVRQRKQAPKGKERR